MTPLALVLVDPPVPDLDARRFDFLPGSIDVRDQDRCAVLGRVTAVDRESDLDAVSLELVVASVDGIGGRRARI